MENTTFLIVLVVLAVWSIPWKGYALWVAGRKRDLPWFILLLVVNTIGILEILYIYHFSKKRGISEPAMPVKTAEKPAGEHIAFEDFQKIHLRVAQIREAKRVEGSDKLIQLKVSIGDEERQIVAGIGKAYQPEDLISKEIIIVANLQPRKLMGVESQGMLLAASEGDMPVLLMPEKQVKPGSRIS